ncbi:MAG TPA: hypothetical protein VN207_07830, partial [Ktedonobacteraceae bacterium]|nr:hypothetical protein [Ktedonobacteraceae bacterium]
MEDIHWIATGSISKAAETTIKYVGGKIMRICSSGNAPSIIVVGLPCQNMTGSNTDVKMTGWEEIFITIPSYGLHLMWSSTSQKQVHMIQRSVQNTRLSLAHEKGS